MIRLFPILFRKSPPRFIEIFSQADIAYHFGLYEICGLGFRKSLEFIVKDYAILFFPDGETDIKSLPLSQCIQKYIASPRLKSLALASAWIGNDETHYTRKNQDYNVYHLRALIIAITKYIDAEITSLWAEQILHPGKCALLPPPF